jgi:YD repeat-containing protein
VGRLIGIWASNFDSYGFAYDNGGRLTQIDYPNGIRQSQSWNADNRLSQISHSNPQTGAVIAQSVYGYDGYGRRRSCYDTTYFRLTDPV